MTKTLEELFGVAPAPERLEPAKRTKAKPEAIRMPSGSLLPEDVEIRSALTEAAERHKISPPLLFALAQQESGYNPKATGPQTKYGRAKGMFQFIDATARGHGIDPLDYRQAADAAAKDLAAQISAKGVDWAIAHHHGGSNPKQHGPKTARYTREVLAKAKRIAEELGVEFLDSGAVARQEEGEPDDGIPTLEELLAGGKVAEAAPQGERLTKTTPEETLLETIQRNRPSLLELTQFPAMGRALKRGWEGVQDIINRETVEVELSDDELMREYQRQWPASSNRPNTMSFSQFARENRVRTVDKETVAQEEEAWLKRLAENPDDATYLPQRLAHLRPRADEARFAPANTWKGAAQRIVANMRHPMDLMLSESLPADVVSYLANLPEHERRKFEETRRVSKALELKNKPDATEEEAEFSNAVLTEWEAKTNPSAAKAISAMWDASKKDPGSAALGLIEAIAADPELLFVPGGVGIKPLRSVRAAAGARSPVTTAAGRATRLADKIIDGTATGIVANVATGVSSNLAQLGEVDQSEVRLNTAMGAAFGGTLAPIFMRGAKARQALANPEAARLSGILDESLEDLAKADIAIEDTIEKMGDVTTAHGIGRGETPMQKAIRENLGIRTPEEAKKVAAARKKAVNTWLRENFDDVEYNKYLDFVAEERVRMAEEVGAAAQAKAASEARAAEIASLESTERRLRLQEEFDAAVLARNNADAEQVDLAWERHEAARQTAEQLNAEELFDALYSRDSSAIKQAEANIKRRESVLRTPKWQRGETNPEALARLGVAAGGAAAGFAVADEDQKLAGTILGGLAGLLVPAGGSVLSRLRQAGAISPDGQIIARLTKAGKLATKLEEAEIVARDNAWMNAARAGDQRAFQNLYETYYGQIARSMKKWVGGKESWLAVDAEDIAQLTFVKAWEALKKGAEIDNFPAYLQRVAQNEVKQATRARESLGRGGDDYTMVSEDGRTSGDSYEGDGGSTFNMIDRHSDLPDFEVGMEGAYDTPETLAVRDEVFDIVRQTVDQMPEQMRRVFELVHLQHYSGVDAAKELGISQPTVSVQLNRAANRINDAIKKNRRKLGEEASEIRAPKSQQGAATTDFMQKTALITTAALAGGTAGYFLTEDPWKGALTGVGAGLLAAHGKASTVGHYIRSMDYRLRDMSPTLYGLAKRHGKQELQNIRWYNDATGDFIDQFRALKSNVKPVVIEALSTRDKTIINRILKEVGGDSFVKAFDKVRAKLDEVEDQLVAYGLIKKSEKDYFPFRVKDLEGLKAELGKEAASEIDAALAAAEKKIQSAANRSLNEIERGIVINKVLEPYLGKPTHGHMPGFAKARTIQRIPERLQRFYHDPVSTLNSYGVQSIKYIERAKFFGKHLKKRKEGGQEFVDISSSIGEFVDDLRRRDQLSDQQVFELKNLLQDRFNGGEKKPSAIITGTKNVVNASLLGQVTSAVTQLADLALQMAQHGPRASTKAAIRMALRKQRRTLSDFGLDEHAAHEFLSDGWTRHVADWSLKYGGFRTIDRTAKNLGLNASIERMMQDARTPRGILRLSDKYQRAFPEEYPKALAALKRGEVSPEVELFAFTDLTNTQPLTQWELPQAYSASPNGRILYTLQTFSLRMMNLLYEESMRDLASGNMKRTARGVKNLMAFGAVLGISGTATDKIKDLIRGKPIELSPEEIPVNALQAFGLGLYDWGRLKDSGPIAGLVESKTPPIVSWSKDLWTERERAPKRLPVAGEIYGRVFRDDIEASRKARRERDGYKMQITVPPKETGGRSSRRRNTRRERDRRR